MPRRTAQGEALAVWALFGADVLAVLVVYSVVAPERLHNVSHGGLAGGLGRAVVQLNYPLAIAALPMILLALAGLPRRAWWLGAPALALCAFVARPGVVDESDLDVKALNAVAAIGVVLAFGLTLAAARRSGAAFARWRQSDRARIAVGVVVVLVSLPWIGAELGVHFPPWPFLTDEPYREPGESVTAAVHLGHHHGFSGTLFVLAALVLSRPAVPGASLRAVYGALVSLLLTYGTANLVQDFWHEQVVKRGWTDWDVPSALEPRLHPIWLLILAGALLVYVLGFARCDTEAA